jgi:N utilization substance protein A
LNNILDILNALANEKGLEFDKVVEVFKIAMVNTAKRVLGEQAKIEIEFDTDNKHLKIYRIAEVVSDDDERAYDNEDDYFYLDEAQDFDENAQIGDRIKYELDFEKLGRNGATMLKKELDYHILRLTEQNLYQKHKERLGELVTGTVIRVDKDENTYIEVGELKGVLPKRNRIKGERYQVGDHLKAVFKYINIDEKKGMIVELSRTTPKFLEALLEISVPEIKDGLIKIEGISRIPGVRAKVAVTSLSPKIDPIGTVIGKGGVRINSISRELKGMEGNENIDVIEYSPKPEIFIARSLSPAIVDKVEIVEENEANITIDSEQKAKAIGKNGINITLANMLTKHKLNLIEKEGTEKKSDISDLEKLFSI